MITVRHVADGAVRAVPLEQVSQLVTGGRGVVWMDVTGSDDRTPALLRSLGTDEFLIEDMLQTATHPKAEARRDHLLLVVTGLDVDADADRFELATMELDVLFGHAWVVTHANEGEQVLLSRRHRRAEDAGAAHRLGLRCGRTLQPLDVTSAQVDLEQRLLDRLHKGADDGFGHPAADHRGGRDLRMNFEYMPELEQRWGYPAVMTLNVLIVVSSLTFFRWKGWIGTTRQRGRRGLGGSLDLGFGRVLRTPAMGARAVSRTAGRLVRRRGAR